MNLLEIQHFSAPGAISNYLLPWVGLMAVAVGIAIALIFCLLAWSHHSHSAQTAWSKTWSYIERHLTIWFYIVLIIGFAIYSVGMMTSEVGEIDVKIDLLNILSVAPIAIIHALEMFLLHSDASAIHEQCHNNFLFMACFSLIHAIAAFISMAFVLKHFGYNIISKIRLLLATRFGKKVDNLYLFWGMNDPSYLLAKDIIKHDKAANSLILFINSSDKSESKESIAGMDRLFSFLSYKNKELDRFKELDCLIANTFHKLSKMDIDPEHKGTQPTLRDELQLASVVRLIQRTTGNIHIFLLGDDRMANIRAVSNLRQDSDIVDAAANNHVVNIYCDARYNSVSRAIENDLSTNNINIRLIDASHDSINELKGNSQFHPINFVDIDTSDNLGTVKSPFNCMIIGFGETGQDALRFLYEFGAFVDSTSDKEDDVMGKLPNGASANIIRSPFHCDIVDPNINNIAGRFLANAPAMDQTQPIVDANGSISHQPMLSLHNFDTQSEAFYKLIREQAHQLNYIVISTGNDDDNITIAVRLFNKLRIARKNLDKLVILVRCYTVEHVNYLQAIANYYNEGTNDRHIVIFGTNEHIYTYDQIIENSFEKRGRDYNQMYCNINNSSKSERWKERHNAFIDKGTLNAYNSLRRKEAQDIANAYHSITKTIILKAAYPGGHSFDELATLICGDGNKCDIQHSKALLSDRENLLLRNLARTEHMRWVASHEVLGYISTANYIATYGDDFANEPYEFRHTCDERRRAHNCIIPWQDLDQESQNAQLEIRDHADYKWEPDYKLYDYGVVATTLVQRLPQLRSAEDNKSNHTI